MTVLNSFCQAWLRCSYPVKIPQVISTDTYLQGIYGYAVENAAIKDNTGIFLVSYSWEDEANKLILEADDEKALAKKGLDELDRILCQCENIKTPISPYVDTSQTAVIYWAKMPS